MEIGSEEFGDKVAVWAVSVESKVWHGSVQTHMSSSGEMNTSPSEMICVSGVGGERV